VAEGIVPKGQRERKAKRKGRSDLARTKVEKKKQEAPQARGQENVQCSTLIFGAGDIS
jgi:hypothetical protein